jgi:hypothetical protein
VGKTAALLLTPLALFLVACGADGPSAGGAGTAVGEPPPIVAEPDGGQLYEVDATVLEDGTHGPMLCLGGILESFPPQCGDVAIAGWDWQAVEGEQSASGTTWGAYHVMGRLDGETFTVTGVAPSEGEPPGFGTAPDFTSPCQEPKGGWGGLDEAAEEDVHRADAYARSQPDYVTSWVTQLQPAELEAGSVIFNAVFTGEAERHEADIRKVWAGPLCVVERDVPTARELERIRSEAEASLDGFGLRMLWSQGPGVEPVIEIGVVVDVGGAGQDALDARYGAGVVRIIPALKPVS